MDDTNESRQPRWKQPIIKRRVGMFSRQANNVRRASSDTEAPKVPSQNDQKSEETGVQTFSTKFIIRIKLPHRSLPHIRIPIIDTYYQKLANHYQKLANHYPVLRDIRVRATTGIGAAIFLLSVIISIIQPFFVPHTYALGSAGALLSPINQEMANELNYDSKQQLFNFNQNYTPQPKGILGATGPQVTAAANLDANKGITVTDPQNQISFTMTPEFSLMPGQQDGNRIIYPISSGIGWVVYTMHSIGVKEDVLLSRDTGNQMTLEYNLGLGSNLSAKIDAAGDIDIYGDTLLSGNVITDDAKDAALLQKARQHAPKNTLLFEIPPPTIKELNTKNATVKASYKLNGSTLQVNVSGLNAAAYPLTIDPSIYVTSAQQFMEGNNETNIDFDVADGLIEKGSTTGARFDEWQSLTNLPDAITGAGTVAAGGYVYSVGGSAFNGQIYSAAGTSTYTVPAGVTTITVKAWGGGGGGGNASTSTGNGGNGGGGGFAQANLTVTPSTNLTVDVGSGGNAGGSNTNGGYGGGYSAVLNGATYLIQAGGGAGGGAGNGTGSGGAGGPGGCSTTGTSCNGTAGTGGAGGGGSTSGGTAGTAGTGGAAGHAGAANAGGDAGGSSTACTTTITGTGDAGGTGGGGKGGTAATCSGGGGGGGGRFGGGGGGSASTGSNRTGGGGGGGSDLVTGSSTTETAGSGTTPGNNTDGYNNGSGVGGTGGGSTATPTPTAGASGLVAIIVTGSSSVNTATVNWEQFNPNDGTLESPNPGTGSCSGWCTNSAYNLPQTLTNFSLVAYNGFLYALGGEDSSCTSGNGTGDTGVCDTVYIAKLGANGEPQLWSPTVGGTQAYWYRGSNLSSPRAMEGAVAYQNRLYMMGGITSSSGTQSVVSTDEEADITGTGTLTSWTTTGMVSLENPANNTSALARYGFGLQQYNGHLYVIGGASSIGGAPSSSAQYITLNSNGTMAGNWLTTTSLENSSGSAEGKMTEGGNFSAVWGAYIYVSGGCTAVNGSGYCTSVASDNQLASINADGSLDQWNVNTAATDSRIEYGLVAWQDSLYEFGGCSVQDATTGLCDGPLDTTTCSANESNVCTIDQDGDASTVSESVASGTAPCSGGSPYNCNLPTAGSSAGDAGQLLSETAILNGYLYMIGGCTGGTDECSTTSTNTAYVSINSDGQLTEPANCTADGNTLSGAWCVDSTHTIGTGVAAGGTAVFNGRIYVVGGLTGSANDNEIYYTTNPFNADGSFGGGWTGTSMTGTGVGTAVAYDYAYARANPSSAGTSPGNLYIFGGCTSTTEEGCNTGGTPYSNAVYKCLISTTGAVSSCSETANGTQLQITDATNPVGGADCGAGLGAMAGAVYANYIYLIGGLTPNCSDLTTLEYAEFNNSNNIVAVSGSTWIQSPMQTQVGRRRGAAFGYNGYLYVLGGYDGVTGTILPDIEFAKIDVTNGSLVDQSGGQDLFNESEVQIGQRWGLTAPVSNSYAYVLGGCDSGDAPTCNSGGLDAQVQTFQLYNNDSGSPASYSTSANTYSTGANRYGVSSAILNGYIYVAGGCTAIDCDTVSNNVSYASIDSNGDIGSWSSTTGNLPASRAWGSLQASGGTLYYIGGQDTTFTSQSTVYYATPSSGNVSSWSTASDGLPNPRSDFGSAVWNNRLYVLGGADGNAGTVSYASHGSYTFVVPSGITSLTIQAWGAGGGGGAGSSSTGLGGAGGGGGFAQDTVTVTPGASLSVAVGSGGTDAQSSSNGGNGGGFSAVQNGATYLIQAGGGGGGGGSQGTGTGGAGGAGGGTTGVSGSAGTGGGGGDGTASAGGTAGTAGTGGVAGSAGAANAGGNAGGSLTSCTTSVSGNTGGAGGTGAGGSGGNVASCSGGGGGGGGRFGGGGGGSSSNTTNHTGGGGGGGSDLVTGSGTTQTAGSGATPGNSTSLTRGSAGVGGNGGISPTASNPGTDGEIVITFGSSTMENTVYVSPQLNSGGNISSSWDTSSTSFNVARTGLTAIAYANNLYILGGFDGTNFLSDVQFAQMSTSSGDVTGSWTYSTNLPAPLYDSSGFAVNGYMYLIGGRSATTTCNPVTLVAPISANTAISSGNDPTGVGNWYQTNSEYSGNRFGDAADYYDGKAFVLGGACGSTFASPVTQQTTLLTQPQVAQYSIMFDTSSDVYPEKWLLNGVDNSIGAEWQLSYRSQSITTNCASSAMTTWGQTTNFGNVTLDDPGVYNALDGSGNNIHCSEFFYMYVSIDSSEAYGYPDDVTRGPTITDLTLEFTANPSKRLMHGRTFTGGLQQPDDTPF